tara:strand:+ start:988 stop:2091 length:1104 start_codon:yes stop_codon:yes gene_type:complete
MDTSDSKILFDESGVCDHCLNFDQNIKPNLLNQNEGYKKANELKERIKKNSNNGEFDCIIGMSGGIDSSYLTVLAVEKLGLKPLVFHVDGGWNTQIAVNNIERIVDSLKLDLYTEVINWEEMRDLQLAYFKSGVPHVDTPQDHAFFATMYKFAVKHNIKTILTGANISTECVRNPIEWMYYQSDSKQLKAIHSKHGKLKKLKKFPLTNVLWHKFYLPYFKKIKVESPLNYFPYKKNDAVTELKERFQWQPYPQKHFESRFTRFYEGYWLYKRFNYDTRRVQFSSLILTGQMTREEALDQLKISPIDEQSVNREVKYVADKLEISPEELSDYFSQPLSTFDDYPNDAWVYALGSKLSRLFKPDIGTKR